VAFHDAARPFALDWQVARDGAELSVGHVNLQVRAARPVFIPPVDLLAFYPGFVSTYQARHLEFDETWFDTSMLLGLPPLRQLSPSLGAELGLLERLMDGRVELDPSGRFQLVSMTGDKREIALVAEGIRKLGVIARLIATGAIEKGATLFWDEPETNLNPKLIKEVARVIVALSRFGVQVCVATHSLFLLRELEMLLSKSPALELRCFGLSPSATGVSISQGDSFEAMGSIAILEEELAQSDRFLAEGSP